MSFARYPAYKLPIKVIKEEKDRRAVKMDRLMQNEQPS